MYRYNIYILCGLKDNQAISGIIIPSNLTNWMPYAIYYCDFYHFPFQLLGVIRYDRNTRRRWWDNNGIFFCKFAIFIIMQIFYICSAKFTLYPMQTTFRCKIKSVAREGNKSVIRVTWSIQSQPSMLQKILTCIQWNSGLSRPLHGCGAFRNVSSSVNHCQCYDNITPVTCFYNPFSDFIPNGSH